MASSWKAIAGLLALAAAGAPRLSAADAHREVRWLDVEFPRDSPVGVMSFGLGESTATVKGTSLALDLHTSLTLRNSSKHAIRGLTLRVEAQDLTPAGRASVTVPSVNVLPGEVFPVRLDLELRRPFNSVNTGSALVQVTLDGVLFDDLSFYGPNQLHSRRSLMVYELEARRDRQYLEKLLITGQTAQLREEMNFGLPDMPSPGIGLELLRDPRTGGHEPHAMAVSFVSFPDAPVQMVSGAAKVYRNEVRTPRVDLRNLSTRVVKNIEMGWILRDERGRDFMAGLLPAAVRMAPVQQASVRESGILRFSRRSGQPMMIDGVTAFVNNVEFADGNLWIPSRRDISASNLDSTIKHAIASSPEQQRLAAIYRKKGLPALAMELKKFN